MVRRTGEPRARHLMVLRVLAAMLGLTLLLAACGDDAADDGGDDAADNGGDAGDGGDDAADDGGDDTAGDGGDAGTAEWPTEEVTLLIPYSPGGGGDAYGRAIAEQMTERYGVNVVPENRPPAIEMFSLLWEAEPDGSIFGYLPMPAAIGSQITTPEVADFETTEFSVIGIVESNSYVVYVAADSEYETIEDLQAGSNLKTLNTDPGSGAALASATLIEGLDLDAESTYGAETSGESELALLRGDIDFTTHGVRDFLGSVENGDLRPLLFMGTDDQKEQEMSLVDWLDDVPTWADVGEPDLAGAVTEHRAFAAPPGLDPALLQAMRDAFEEVVSSEGMQQWSDDSGRLLFPAYGEEAQEVVNGQAEAMRDLLPELDLAE